MVLGGRRGDDKYSKLTYFVNLETFEIKDGPQMENGRLYAGCNILEQNNRLYVIAAGGWTNSTEVLDLSSTDLRWSKGVLRFLKKYELKAIY